MFGQTHSTIQDTTIRTTPADVIALGRGISGLACVYPRVLECTTGTRRHNMDTGVRWRVAPQRRVHDTTAGSRRIPSAPGTGLDPP